MKIASFPIRIPKQNSQTEITGSSLSFFERDFSVSNSFIDFSLYLYLFLIDCLEFLMFVVTRYAPVHPSQTRRFFVFSFLDEDIFSCEVVKFVTAIHTRSFQGSIHLHYIPKRKNKYLRILVYRAESCLYKNNISNFFCIVLCGDQRSDIQIISVNNFSHSGRRASQSSFSNYGLMCIIPQSKNPRELCSTRISASRFSTSVSAHKYQPK